MTLHGTVNPEGTPVEECVFEYGTSEEYEDTVPCEPKAEELGSSTNEVPVQAKIAGLRGGTVYHFRVVARKGSATVPGKDLQAGTPPIAVLSGEEATEVTAGGARLNALVDPEGLPVSRCEFEYGTGTAYGHVVRCEQKLAQIGFGAGPVPVSAQLAGLEANVTYHWRLSVRDPNGEAVSSGHTFVYRASGSGAGGLPDDRAYEMVTPPFKNGASVGTVLFGLHATPPGPQVGLCRRAMSRFGLFNDAPSPRDGQPVGRASRVRRRSLPVRTARTSPSARRPARGRASRTGSPGCLTARPPGCGGPPPVSRRRQTCPQSLACRV